MSEKRNEYQAGRKNLLVAVITSIPGPVALVLSLGESTTQLADFLRRSCELLSVVLAFVLFEISNRKPDCNQGKLETLVRIVTGLSMVFSGAVIGWLAVSNFGSRRGSVITSLVLAVLGTMVNAKLYWGYRKLQHGVLNIQAKLHWVKMLLDIWMTGVLLICTFASGSIQSYGDLIGSASIAMYVIFSGIRLLRNKEVQR